MKNKQNLFLSQKKILKEAGCKELTKKFDAVTLVKLASKVLGGKGGGGRKDFAQAGGNHKDKIDEAFKILNDKIS